MLVFVCTLAAQILVVFTITCISQEMLLNFLGKQIMSQGIGRCYKEGRKKTPNANNLFLKRICFGAEREE